ncbi:hypothetical protein Hs30E_20690 [Lactococcus hodotermopsidis]|uniref:DUF4352 domain-containing protein n=1 Tax=Pseudolactococcus hodotermopsidis TaxID=2709157 RepID=A0A6A0BDH7_9LACT|nr:DUF4352 domain-containing protein [Lactococcus hodotermopsidis]GFH43489.1 hypothetical protein Hs30E_20690 [Lactococcus hodotermopsidis]
MAKKIEGEDGKVYKEQKPVYKRIWFILLVALVVIVVVTSSGGDKGAKKVTTDDTTTKTSEKEQDVFKVGDTVEVNGVHFKVNSVEFTDGEEYNEPDEGKKFVVVNVTIENQSKKVVSYNPLDFGLDDQGNVTDFWEYLSGVETLSYGTLKEGGTVSGNLIGQAKQEDKLKLDYTGNMFDTSSKLSIELN